MSTAIRTEILGNSLPYLLPTSKFPLNPYSQRPFVLTIKPQRILRLIKATYFGTGVVIESRKCLSHKQEDQSLDSQHPCKKEIWVQKLCL